MDRKPPNQPGGDISPYLTRPLRSVAEVIAARDGEDVPDARPSKIIQFPRSPRR